jgi:hypothetical protein
MARRVLSVERVRSLSFFTVLALTCATARADDEISYSRSDTLLVSTAALGVLHVADHFMRKDSSGWPVEGGFSPIDGVAIGLPLYIGAGYKLDAGPLYWIAGDSALLLLVGLEHATRENPFHVHDTWTHPDENVPGINSPGLGVTSNVVVGLLLTSMAAHIASNVKDGIDHGFTWKRRRHRDSGLNATHFDVLPTRGGASVGLGFAF